MMCYEIDSRFSNLPNFRNNINNILNRCIWFLGETIQQNIGVQNYITLDPRYKSIIVLLDIFCSLSLRRNRECFSYYYRKNIKFLRKLDILPSEDEINVPYDIYDRTNRDTIKSILPISSMSHIRASKKRIYRMLNNVLKNKMISIQDLFSIQDNYSFKKKHSYLNDVKKIYHDDTIKIQKNEPRNTNDNYYKKRYYRKKMNSYNKRNKKVAKV
jgi:hypothetical protein